jgi:hypothetical protein
LAISARAGRNVDFEDNDPAFQLTAQGLYGSNALLVSVPGDQNSIFDVEMQKSDVQILEIFGATISK